MARFAEPRDAVEVRSPNSSTLAKRFSSFPFSVGVESFAGQVAAAVEAGCAGFMVGRALWGDAARAEPDRRQAVIDEIVRPRWEHLRTLT